MDYISLLQILIFILLMLLIIVVSTAKATDRYITYDTKGEENERE